MINSRILLIAILILIVVGGGAFLFTKNASNTSPSVPTPTQAMMMQSETPTASPSESMTDASGTPMPSTAMKESGTVKEITVTGSSYKFVPATITVKKGDTVKVNFVNSGGMHDFVIDEFDVTTKVIPGGQSETVTFVADKAGTYEYYCSVGNHKQMGMVGKLIVQ